MEFITAAILGGLLYDTAKLSLSTTVDIVKVGLKSLILTDDEIIIISESLEANSINSGSSLQQYEEAINKIENIDELLKSISYKNETIQNNKIGTVNGAVIGTNTAPINMTFGKNN